MPESSIPMLMKGFGSIARLGDGVFGQIYDHLRVARAPESHRPFDNVLFRIIPQPSLEKWRGRARLYQLIDASKMEDDFFLAAS